ncbi:hypothetical protein A3H90_02155 [Candidatus Peribacteria bacterium RIFCSPLOWO2_02_FULL_55_36]|nr:MAG: hypothetical protein A3H90_02155 [Candidatus Peribacteria bacterium RIFCSPLOWO2_02_FULL_55_36]
MSMPSRFALLPLPLLLLTACNRGTSNTTNLTIKGSDTEVQLVSNLAEAFARHNTSAHLSVTGGGSATGIASLLNGEIDIANSSRPMSDAERAQASERGIDLQEFILARDGLSIILHPENPITTLSMQQLSDIYSGRATRWKDIGGSDAPIVLYGRQSTSGTFGFFRDTVVKDDYAQTMRNMEGNQAIVDAVRADANGIGYVGVGYVKDDQGNVRDGISAILISLKNSNPVSPLDREAVKRGDYPISRPIYQYLPAVPPRGSPAEAFLRFEASSDGQAIVEASGFYAITAEDVQRNSTLLAKIH